MKQILIAAIFILIVVPVSAQSVEYASQTGPLLKAFDREGWIQLSGKAAEYTIAEKCLIPQLDNAGLIPKEGQVIVVDVQMVASYTCDAKDGERVDFAQDFVYRAVGYVGDQIRIFERRYGVWGFPGAN